MTSGKTIFEKVQGKSFVSERGARKLCSRFWRKVTMCDAPGFGKGSQVVPHICGHGVEIGIRPKASCA